VAGGNQVRVEDMVRTVPDAAAGTATPARPIRVCVVCGPGGAELDGVGDYVERLIGALRDAGVQATAVPIRPHDGLAAPGWWAAAWRAARRVRRMRPDLVHVQFAPSAYRFSRAPWILPLLLGTSAPLVVTVHEYGWWPAPSWLPRAVWRALERTGLWDRETGRLVPSASAVIVTNPEHAAQIRARTGRAAVEVPLAANVTDHGATPEDRRRIRDELGLAPDDLLLAFFGFVHPVKGMRYLLEALAVTRTRRPGTRLLVIGGFTSQALPEHEARAFRAELDRLAHRYGVADAVTFTGYLPAPAASRMLHAADVAVLPYTAGVTAKSGALLTVLAHGLPTAVTVPGERDRPAGPDRRDGLRGPAHRAPRTMPGHRPPAADAVPDPSREPVGSAAPSGAAGRSGRRTRGGRVRRVLPAVLARVSPGAAAVLGPLDRPDQPDQPDQPDRPDSSAGFAGRDECRSRGGAMRHALCTMLARVLSTAVAVTGRPVDEPAAGHRGPDRGAVPGCVEVIAARRDAAAIADAVERLAADPALRRRLAAAGRRYAARRSWPRVAAAHRYLYAELAGGRGG